MFLPFFVGERGIPISLSAIFNLISLGGTKLLLSKEFLPTRGFEAFFYRLLVTIDRSYLRRPIKTIVLVGWPHSTMDSGLTSHPEVPGSIPGVSKNFSEFLILPGLIDTTAD